MYQQSSSLWDATAPPSSYEPLRGDLHVDVAIVGAGIAGLTAALLLAEKGHRVAVLEQEAIGSGDAGESGDITVAVDARYHHLKRQHSKEEARLVADATRAALEKIAELVQRLSIDCHFRRVPGYLYTEKRKYVAELKNEANAAREVGLDAQWTADVPLPFETRGAVLWPNQAQCHPREYLAGLAKHAVAAGARVFERTLATKVEAGVVETEHGRVTADHVFTTAQAKVSTCRTYAIAFAAKEPHPEGLFRDTAEPSHHTRWQETNEGTFLIVGGEDHRTGEHDDAEGSFSRLAEYARECYGPDELRYRWSRQIVEPDGGLPRIGPSGDRVYVATGYARQGMTFGTLGGMLVSDLILGVSNPWADLF